MSTDLPDDIGLDATPTVPFPAQPPNAPAPVPSPPGPASTRLASLRRDVLLVTAGIVGTVGLIAALILASAWLERGPAPAPSVDGVALGRAFVQPLAGALADSLDGEAAAIEGKTPVDKANADARSDFRARLNRAFAEANADAFSKILPPETEPKDDVQRAEFAHLLRDFAKGLREAR